MYRLKTTSTLFLMILICVFSLVSAGVRASQWVDEHTNPMDVTIADPMILKDGGNYYLYGTAGYEGFDVWQSTNLMDWRKYLWAYGEPSGDPRNCYWAAEVIKRPSDGKYLMFYTARMSDGMLRIHVAQSNSPTTGFTDVKVPLFNTGAESWLDANPFIDTNGQAYLYVVKDVETAGSGNGQGGIFVAPLDLNNLTIGALTYIVAPNTTGWEAGRSGEQQIEGPFMVKHNSQYFLLYSGGAAWASSYAVGYAVSTSPTGGFSKYAGNPILKSGWGLPGPGHCSVTTGPDGSEYFIAYHVKTSGNDGWDRMLAIDRMNFMGNPGSEFIQVFGITGTGGTAASCVPQIMPSGTSTHAFAPSYDAFNSLTPGATWHIMNENGWNWNCSNGNINITSSSGDFWAEQSGISNLFLAYAAQDSEWQITAKVTVNPTVPFQQAFITIWQDSNNYVRLSDVRGTPGHEWQVIKEELGSPTSYFVANGTPTTKWLRIKKSGGHFDFFGSGDGVNYSQIGSGYDAGFATNRTLQFGFGAICPDGNGGSAPAITANFQDFWYDRLSTYSPGVNDDFNDNSLDRKIWVIHNEDQARWAEESGSVLRIRTQDGDWAGARTDARNIFLQSAKSGNFTITTSLRLPTEDGNYDQAFLIIANNHNNFVKFARGYINGRKFEAGVENGGAWSANTITDSYSAGSWCQMRIRKVGTTYYYEASPNGTTWTSVGTKTASWTPMFVGIGATSPGAGHQHDYYFDWFNVN